MSKLGGSERSPVRASTPTPESVRQPEGKQPPAPSRLLMRVGENLQSKSSFWKGNDGQLCWGRVGRRLTLRHFAVCSVTSQTAWSSLPRKPSRCCRQVDRTSHICFPTSSARWIPQPKYFPHWVGNSTGLDGHMQRARRGRCSFARGLFQANQ